MKILALLAVLLTAFATATADSTATPVTMWKAHGTDNTVYLLGSIHLLREQDHPLPAAIDAAYRDADVLFMEIDMDDLDPVAAQTAFTTHGVLRDGTRLRDLMGAADFERAVAAAEKLDIPLHLLDRTEPWYAALTVEILSLSRIGYDARWGVESHMMAKAAADGKPIEGFETLQEQVAFLDGLSLPAQRQLLLSTLEEGSRRSDLMDGMIAAWRNGDTAFMEAEMLNSLAEFDELYRTIVTDRNSRWVERIQSLLNDEQDYLVIVGALHLIGADGVPRQLRELGVSIEQLSDSSTLR